MKTQISIITYCLVLMMPNQHVNAQTATAESQIAIEQFKKEPDGIILARAVTRIKSNSATSEQERLASLVNIVNVINVALESTTKPTKAPELNVAPPNGALSGVDPSQITDPEARRQYEERIAENEVLIKQHKQYRTLKDTQASILNLLATYYLSSEDNKRTLTQIIDNSTSGSEKSKEIKVLIEKEVQIRAKPSANSQKE